MKDISIFYAIFCYIAIISAALNTNSKFNIYSLAGILMAPIMFPILVGIMFSEIKTSE